MCFSKYGFREYGLKPGSFTLQMQSQEITKQGILSSQQGNLHILTSKIGRIRVCHLAAYLSVGQMVPIIHSSHKQDEYNEKKNYNSKDLHHKPPI